MLKRIVRVLALGALSVPMLLMAAGCYEKLNGGGWMLSANGEDRATFGIHFEVVDPIDPTTAMSGAPTTTTATAYGSSSLK